MERKIEPKDEFLAGMQRKHNKGGKDNEALKAKPMKMKDLDYAEIPRKTHLMNDLSKPSAKKQKSGENQLQGGMPKSML